MAEEKVSTLIVEDHEITRLGIKKMLEKMAGICVVGEAKRKEEAISIASDLQPDLILMDIGLPGESDGIDITRIIKKESNSKVIMLTVHDNEDEIKAALTAGADGYCLKSIPDCQLEQAIWCVINGGTWLDPSLSKQLRKIILQKPAESSQSDNGEREFKLSERELEVLGLLVEGLNNQQMARRLGLSPETIKTHMKHLMDKLSVTDRTQAAVKALKEGIIS